MVVVLVVVVWVAIGVLVGSVEARHGHWSKSWVLGALAGPLAILLAVAAHRGEVETEPRTVVSGDEHHGGLDVLVGVDGSAASLAAVSTAAGWFGGRLGRLTLATVLDLDTAAPHADSVLQPGPWPEEVAAETTLESVVAEMADRLGFRPEAVVLAGRPADALESYALGHGFDVIVIGCRGGGLSKALLGSCASSLAGGTRLPVMLIPDPTSNATSVASSAEAGERE